VEETGKRRQCMGCEWPAGASAFDIDFTEGGHDHVYEFVPGVRSGSTMQSRRRTGLCAAARVARTESYDSRLALQQAHAESSRWNSGAAPIPMNCMMRLRLKAGHDLGQLPVSGHDYAFAAAVQPGPLQTYIISQTLTTAGGGQCQPHLRRCSATVRSSCWFCWY